VSRNPESGMKGPEDESRETRSGKRRREAA
jgi:hypothetical protein